jgi:tetratricopeptide (TPR) repeat protein
MVKTITQSTGDFMKYIFLGLVFLSSLIGSTQAQSYEPYPCRTGNANTSIDLFNSDDLFFTGRFLSRNGKPIEAIQCLNRAKTIAPAYIDVRLELMNAFHNLGDKTSGLKEAKALNGTELTFDYQETYQIYYAKLQRITRSINPMQGFEYLEIAVTDLGMAYKKIDDLPIINEKSLKEAVAMKHRGEFANAKTKLTDHVLPYNSSSATVFMYSGIIYSALNEFQSAETFFNDAIKLAPRDVDVTLLLMRAIYSNGFPNLALNYAKVQSKLFVDYGCIKLAGNVSDIFGSLGLQSYSSDIEQFVIRNNQLQKPESNVCGYIKAVYL